jgi:hypothetical protein
MVITGGMASTGIVGTAAHIQEGAAGVNGPVVITLTGGVGGVWTIPSGTVLTSTQLTSLKAGNYYFNIASAAHPDGEIRGQIKLTTFFASLTGAQETPATGSTATGTGVLSVNAMTGDAYGTILTQGITGTASHVHEGATGVSGNVLLPLQDAGGGKWTLPVGSLLTSAQVTTFQAGGLYGNVHSAAFPNGEIRGQFNLGTALIRRTTLSGANEVPANTSGATGTGTLTIDPVTLVIRGGIITSGIVGTGAHLYQAAPGTFGAIIVHLYLDTDGGWVIPPGTVLTPSQFDDLRKGNMAFDVESVAHGEGEIRGWLPADGSTSGGGGGGGY